MTISFNDVPSNLRVPFVTAEFDASRASQGPALLAYRALLIGQKIAGGSAVADSLHRVTRADDVIPLAGRGSMLHRMAIAYFASNRVTETWIGVLADNGAGVAATGTITFTGPATANGTIALYLGGELVSVGVLSGDAATAVATAAAAAINADADLPITAAAVGAVVTWTFRHKGLSGNAYDVRHSFADGQALPAGVTVAIVAGSGGTTSPVLTSLIANMGDSWFHVWAHPYTDATSLTALEAELVSRSGPMRMIDALAITAATGTFSTLASLGNTRNSQHSLIVAQPGINPLTPPMEFAAEVAGIMAQYGAADPARPFQTLVMAHAQAPAETDLFDLTERNLLLFDGIATTGAAVGGVVALERMITTYRLGPSTAPDDAYLDATTLLTLQYLRYSFRVRFKSKYPRHKLGSDGTRFGPGQKVMTPKLGKAEALGWFREMEGLGLVENFDQFRADLVVERNATDPNRLDLLLPPDLINQLIVTAGQIQFRL